MSMTAIAQKLEAIREKASLRSSDIAQVLEATPETVSRWNQGKAVPHPRTQQRILELEYIADQLSDLFKPDESRLWLYSPQKLLNHKTPAFLVQQGKAAEVIDLIAKLNDGVYL